VSGGLEAAVQVCRGTLHLEADLRVAPGETVAVVGPNGAGKTTLLRAIAGLEAIDAGRVAVGGRILEEAPAGRFVPPDRRSMGVVFQDHRLFPHLSALDNVAFGLRNRGLGRRAARREAAGWLERVGLGGRAASRPAQLSGGQAQRVALARALAVDPEVLLLDEPLAALDATTRPATRRQLRADLGAHPGVRVLVTHDILDAAAVAHRLVVLEHGRIVQEGTVTELARRPSSRYVADLVGANLYPGRGEGRVVVVEGGFRLTVAEAVVGEVIVRIAPRAVVLSGQRPATSARNAWEARVELLEPAGDRVRVRVGGPLPIVAEVTPAAVTELALAGDARVWVAVKATEVDVDVT